MRLSASLPLAVLAFSALAFSMQSQSAAQTVAATPPMGWNSWNYFAEKSPTKTSAIPPTRSSQPA